MMIPRVTFFLLFLFFLFHFDSHAALSTKKKAPSFQEIKKWVTPETPFHENHLKGKVFLVSFLGPSNPQSLWEMRLLSRWYERYNTSAPFEIVGISIPEFQFEKDITQTEPALHKLKLPFPVALDPEKKLWNAYEVRSLPFHFLIDANGLIRNSYSKNIDYAILEDNIQTLLKETFSSLPSIEKTNIPAFRNLPSLFFGYRTLAGYGGNETLQAERMLSFLYPEKTDDLHFYLSGNWIPKEESLKTALPLSSIKMLFDASIVFLVAGTERRNLIPAEVRLDGLPLSKEIKGGDIVLQEGKSYVFIKDYRLYNLLRTKKPADFHTLELLFEEPGIELFKASFE